MTQQPTRPGEAEAMEAAYQASGMVSRFDCEYAIGAAYPIIAAAVRADTLNQAIELLEQPGPATLPAEHLACEQEMTRLAIAALRGLVGRSSEPVGVFDTEGGRAYLDNLEAANPTDLTRAAIEQVRDGRREVRPPYERDPGCVTVWPECTDGHYDPRCCRFPKSCSCAVVPTPSESREHAEGHYDGDGCTFPSSGHFRSEPTPEAQR